MADDSRDNEVFIDADSGFSNEKDSYEALILKQMAKCAEVLSRDMTPGQVVHKESKTGTEKYLEDVPEIVINHIDTLRMLLCTYIKDHNKKQIDIILNEIKEFKEQIGERKIILPGKGHIHLKDIKGVDSHSIHWKEFVVFKALKHREMFEVLVNCYNEQKAEIRALETE
jgi:hypothetical protein